MPNLPKIISYDDLNGAECKEILAARFWKFLENVPEFQLRFALTRVKLRLEIAMDVWGATPPRKIVHDDVEITATHDLPSNMTRTVTEIRDVEEVDAFNNPPDQIREEHALPVPRAQRSPVGTMETVPVVLEGMTPKYPPAPKPDELHVRTPLPPTPATQASPTTSNVIMGHRQRKPYASVVELDHGSIQRGERGQQPVIGDEKFAEHIQTHTGAADVLPQFDFVHSPERTGKQWDEETLKARAARDAKNKE